MSYLRGTEICFAYEGQVEVLFDDLNFEIDHGYKVGLIGKNGCGKTTLLKILLGNLLPLKGDLHRRENLRIGYLPQEVRFPETITVSEYLWQAEPRLAHLKNRIETMTDYNDPQNLTCFAEFEERGGYQFEVRFEKVLAEFQFNENMLSRSISTLSGGEKTKIALCQTILREPNLLLLDEPTNHLDMETLIWLEQYLDQTSLPFLVISHDRAFLDHCVNRVWELEFQELREYRGNYSFYKQEKMEEFQLKMHQYENQQRKIKQLKKTLGQRKGWALTHQGQTGTEGRAPAYESITNFSRKAMKRAKNVEKRLEMMLEKEEAKKPFIEKERKVMMPDTNLKTRFVLRVENLSKSFTTKMVFENISFAVENGARLAITGRNGSGKSTLLKIICGQLNADAGQFSWTPQVTLGYYAQELENLDFSQTIIDEVLQGRQDKEQQTFARTILGTLNIVRDQVYQRIDSLSLGERCKVSLTKIILSGANVLVLDEPTNHLEISAREAIEDALLNFTGTIIFVSHDRYLREKLTTHEIDMDTLI